MPRSSRINTVSVTKALAAAENYQADDVLSESVGAGTSWVFSGIVNADGGSGRIIAAQVICETIGCVAQFSLYLFTAVPTSNLNDNVANTAPIHADLANYVGRIDFPAMDSQGGDSDAIAVSGSDGLPLPFECAEAANDLWGILVMQGAFNNEVDDDEMTVRITRELI